MQEGVWVGYMQIYHFVLGTWALVDFGICGGPGTNVKILRVTVALTQSKAKVGRQEWLGFEAH